MTERQAFQALLDGEVIEKVFTNDEPSFIKIENGRLVCQSYRTRGYQSIDVDSVFNGASFRRHSSTKTITIDGKDIEISEESYNKLKESLT